MGWLKGIRNQKGTWFVQKGIPADVRHAFGKKQFKVSTGTHDEAEANAKAGPILLGWTRQIEAVRHALQKPVREEVERLASEFRRYRGKPLDEAGATVLMEAISFMMDRFPKANAPTLLHRSGSLGSLVQHLPDPIKGQSILDQVLQPTTPFLTYIEDYRKVATTQNPKTLNQAISGIKKFALAVDQPIETLNGGHVQKWLYGLMSEKHPQKKADRKTKIRRLSELNGYWKYLVASDYTGEDRANPFLNRITANQETDSEAQERKRLGFPAADVPKLWRQAEQDQDASLANVIRLSAYSGARLDEIMNLTKDAIYEDSRVLCIRIFRGKTPSARRWFPVHPDIKKLVRKLMMNADKDGFLIHSSAEHRAAAMSQKFGRMKTKMGYGPLYVEHSIRHTVIQMFREAEIRQEVQFMMMGHAEGDQKMNASAGYGDLSAKGRLKALVRAIRYP
jgi:integrase